MAVTLLDSEARVWNLLGLVLAMMQVALRHTRIRMHVARMTFTAAVKDMPRYRGIVPDIVV